MNAAISAADTAIPGRASTNARPTSPHFASGTPITAACATASCWAITASTSAGYTFSPPDLYISFRRPRTQKNPSASRDRTSPVRNQPSTSDCCVAAGSRK